MRNRQTNYLLKSAACGALALAIMAAPPLLATVIDLGASAEAATWPNKKSQYKKDKRKVRFQAVSESFGRKIDKLSKASEKKDWAAFESTLNDMRPRLPKYNAAEKINFYFAEIELIQVKMDLEGETNPKYQGYDEIISRYQKLLEMHKELSESRIRQILYALASYHLQGEGRADYLKALDYLHEWLGMYPEVKPRHKFLIGNTHYLLKDMNLALEWIEEAIADTLAAGEIPKERWYDLQKFIYYEKKNHVKVAEILETLVRYYPKAKYWEQLGATYRMDLERPIDGLVAFDALYMQDKLRKTSYIKTLAYEYMNNDAPYEMAEIFEWAMKNGHMEETENHLKQLYHALRRAGETERSIKALERYNNKASDGEMLVELANQYIRIRDYEKAVEASKKAKTAKKKMRKPGSADFVAGVSYFYLKKYDQSLKAFRLAAKDPKTKGTAEPWISYVADRINELKEIREREKLLREALAEFS